MLYGPFTDQLPNVAKYLDPENIENNYDFGMKIDGYEAPYGRAQFVIIGDSAKVGEMPTSVDKLKDYVEKNKRVFTYPEVTDFTGSAFVRTIIYNTCDLETIKSLPADEDSVRKAIAPAMTYLKEIAPNLWREGKTYPTNLPQLDNMYADGEVNFTMNYAPFTATQKTAKGEWKETTETFVMDKGTVGNTNYLAIPFNSVNKAGAALVINTILTPEMQGTKANPLGKGDIPVIEDGFMSAEEKALFVFNNEGTISIDTLESKRLPEFSSEVVPIVEKIWREEILGGK